jgi:predicted DNA-binding WGR domain protein
MGESWSGKAPKNKRTQKKKDCPYFKNRKTPFTFKHGSGKDRDINEHYILCYGEMYKDCQKKTKQRGVKTRKGQKGRGKIPKYGIGKHKFVYVEYKKGGSHKFWQGELSRQKDVMFVTYGRVGTKGRSTMKRLGQYTPTRAQEMFQKLVESKLKKGYMLKNKVVYDQ